MYITPIFCGDMAGKITQFTSTNATSSADITIVDNNGPIRIDSLSASIDDVVQAVIRVSIHDGTNSYPIGIANLNRPIKNNVTNASITFTWAATTITRSAGSWLTDGFKIGDMPIIQNAPDTANNLIGTQAITALTDTVMTLGNANMTARAATYGQCSISLANNGPACTDILAAAAVRAGIIGYDSAGNKFWELPKGWKLQAAFISALSTGKTVNVQSHWGLYAGV